ncbi:hypothetical protein ACFYNO_15105 [Kitasatospora sp. NPDC006697]|uniref:hypothetical protein n=1 Tax=unclassified Kitasatospora TaxID=2633591 RepID=UPI003684EA84
MYGSRVPAQAQASFPSRPVWLPAHTVRLYCGRTFDALRCNEPEAETVLAAIGPACGPVITSALGYSDLLLPPGEHFREAVPRASGVRMMPQGTQIDVPPLIATPSEGLYWRVPPGVGTTRLADVAAALRPPAPPGAGRRAGPPLAERPAAPTWRPVQ